MAGISDVGTIVLSVNDLEKKYPTEFMRCDGRNIDKEPYINERIPNPYKNFTLETAFISSDFLTGDHFVINDVLYFCNNASLHTLQNDKITKASFINNSNIIAWFVIANRIGMYDEKTKLLVAWKDKKMILIDLNKRRCLVVPNGYLKIEKD